MKLSARVETCRLSVMVEPCSPFEVETKCKWKKNNSLLATSFIITHLDTSAVE